MLRELLTGIVGLCGGMVVATALAAFIIGLGMIPRYAGVTHTGNHLLFYENSLMLGSFWEICFYFIEFISIWVSGA